MVDNPAGYLGMAALILGLGYAARWISPDVTAQLARKTGLTARAGWLALAVVALWIPLPILAGAPVGDGELWAAGAAVSAVGVFLTVMAATALDEYRLLGRATPRDPDEVAAGSAADLVVTDGVPGPAPADGADSGGAETPPDDWADAAGGTDGSSVAGVVGADTDADVDPDADRASGGRPAPFSGRPAVHADWLVQARREIGFRTGWVDIAGGVVASRFGLGDGAVGVTPGRHRVFTNVETILDVAPDEDLPKPAAAFFDSRPELPDPAARDTTLRLTESVVPADEPVTVVGTAVRTPEYGTARVDAAPPDSRLGTHTDHTAGDDDPEPVVIRGDRGTAERFMRKRTRWLAAAGLVLIVSGQAAAFRLSAASLGTLVPV